jgi:flagellin
MAGTVNTNIGATRAAAALTKNERDMNTAMERLSTGKRINSAQDDAAGLAIASRMTSQINSLDQAIRNAQDAVSMVMTIDGAMVEVTNMVQRMRQLAIQAISDTNTASDRAALNLEFQALSQEVSRIGGNTQWNGGNVLDGQVGENGTSTFHVGANANQVIQVTFPIIGSQEGDFTASVATAATGDHLTGVAQISELSLDPTFPTLRDGDTLTYTVDGYAASATIGYNEATGEMTLASSSNVTLGTTAANGAGLITLSIEAGDEGNTDGGQKFTLTAANTGHAFTIENVQMTRGIGANVAQQDIMSFTTATNALDVLDKAVADVNMKRADLGAIASRLNYASDNMANISMNARQSRSRVEDADYARETTELARTQIIQQAGTAMLAQANQSAQAVLKLLNT